MTDKPIKEQSADARQSPGALELRRRLRRALTALRLPPREKPAAEQ